MTKEELLKIYSAYLPYGLQIQHKYQKAKHNGETVLRSWIKPLEHLDLGCLFPHRKDSFDWKPILYDLSYLTKEIEHEGESFIPIVELLKIKFPNQQGRYATTEYSTYGHPFACFRVDAGKQIRINTSDLENQPYWIIQKLTEWKLNVFGLEESEYINKATLTNK